MLGYGGYPINPSLTHSQIQNMGDSHQSLLTLNEVGFYGNKEGEGNILGWDLGNHTRNRKWSCLEDIDHYNGEAFHVIRGISGGRVIFMGLLRMGLGSRNE